MTLIRCLRCERKNPSPYFTRAVLSFVGWAWVWIGAVSSALAESPFDVQVRSLEDTAEQIVEITVHIPPGHYIYAESWQVRSPEGTPWVAVNTPRPKTIFDRYAEEEKQVFAETFRGLYRWDGPAAASKVVVELQGCDDHVCFFPEERSFELSFAGSAEGGARETQMVQKASGQSLNWEELVQQFDVAGMETGYVRKQDFLRFLNRAVEKPGAENPWIAQLRRAGPWLGAGLILLGGVLLNLTPCVLPMIPVNLAIIGAGVRAGTKRTGFAMGAVYGLGMAVAYGATGVVSLLTGSTFGALNASPWFNAAIALLFVVLALAAFDVITIDFSRYQSSIATPATTGRKKWGVVFFLGVISALLAGACVAPVVISVLLLSGTLYGQGYWFAIFLPFLLGLGMALPWPLAGAGLALLPRPGEWMTWVKRGFGVFILALAIYYGWTSVGLFRGAPVSNSEKAVTGESAFSRENEKLAAALRRALGERKPVFLDFWATWCKNCTAMEKTTFRAPEVVQRLQAFEVVRYQAEQPDAPETKPVLQHFNVGGLPTYIVLVPRG